MNKLFVNMMKKLKLFFIFVAVLITSISISQTDSFKGSYKAGMDTILFYDFTDTTGWSIGTLFGTINRWHIGTPTANLVNYTENLSYPQFMTSGDPMAFVDGITLLVTAQYGETNAWLQSPLLDFTGVDTVFIEWKQIYRFYNNDSTFIDISLDGGNTWPSMYSYTLPENHDITSSAYPPVNYSENISAYVANQSNVRIRFRWFGQEQYQGQQQFGGGYGWQIDDVLFCSATTMVTSIEAVSQVSIRSYPNPVNDFFIVEGNDVERILIFNVLGEMIEEIQLQNSFIKIDCSDYKKSIYIIKAENRNGKELKSWKFVKN